MNGPARYAYAQSRLQARHGNRPKESLWRMLASSGDLANYIQAARRTTLRPWVLGLQAGQSSHVIEHELRKRYRHYVGEVAMWLPAEWYDAIRWLQRLPDLPALQYLLSGEDVPAWMLDDPELRAFASGKPSARVDAMRDTDRASLVAAAQQDASLPEAWLDHWRQLWPGGQHAGSGMLYLDRLLRRYIQAVQTTGDRSADHRAMLLLPGLNYAFRRFSFEPAAACAHLGLVAMDLEQLRGELVQRALFVESVGLSA